MNKKIKKYLDEIAKTEKKIADLQQYLRGVQAALKQEEDNENKQLGSSTINSYLQQIGYGNKNISGDFSSYWMQSSLKISPVEQVELLKNLYRNNFNFTPANIHAVKNSIHLTASENGEFMEKPEPDE